jgi:hypothetical protein
MGNLEAQDLTAKGERRVRPVQLDHPVAMEDPGQRDHLVITANRPLANLDQKDHPANLAPPVNLAQLASLAMTANLAALGPLAHLVTKARLALLENRARMAALAVLATQDLLALVPSVLRLVWLLATKRNTLIRV